MSPLMPKATAVWLLDNTSLTFSQIAEFCHLHPLEIKAIADGESAVGMLGLDPISSGQLTFEEIHRCEKDEKQKLILTPPVTADSVLGKKKKGYSSLSKRRDRPDAISWLLKFTPELSDAQICRLLGTTKATVQGIRTKTYWNMHNVKQRNPVHLGFCSQIDLDQAVEHAKMGIEKLEEVK